MWLIASQISGSSSMITIFFALMDGSLLAQVQGLLARIFHESPAAAADLVVLPGVLGCRTMRRTNQVRLRSNTLWLPGTRRKRLRCAWPTHLHGLATAIHEISGLVLRYQKLSLG
jgi:hypothetical protein